jgi:hypothetical protein
MATLPPFDIGCLSPGCFVVFLGDRRTAALCDWAVGCGQYHRVIVMCDNADAMKAYKEAVPHALFTNVYRADWIKALIDAQFRRQQEGAPRPVLLILDCGATDRELVHLACTGRHANISVYSAAGLSPTVRSNFTHLVFSGATRQLVETTCAKVRGGAHCQSALDEMEAHPLSRLVL